MGQDKDSIVADPLFVDLAHGDFTLRPASPAAQIGFEPWDLAAFGPRPRPAASTAKLGLVLAPGDAGAILAQSVPRVGNH